MKTIFSAAALAAAIGLCAAPALAQPSGGPDAKGNAPLKHAHTVNDGAAKPGHSSFTEGQARKHIEKAGFSGVTGLVKGQDGVWRGQAVRGGQTLDVAMDFKGNVSTGGAPSDSMSSSSTSARAATAPNATPAMAATSTTTATVPAVHHHHRHASASSVAKCANPGPNGAACSGVDTNGKGVSDREERAIQKGAHP